MFDQWAKLHRVGLDVTLLNGHTLHRKSDPMSTLPFIAPSGWEVEHRKYNLGAAVFNALEL